MERTPSRREGYERVVAQYGRPLLVYVARLLGSASEAEDVVQDVFVKFAQLWKGPLEPDARMTAWLRTTAHNLAVDAMRASARRAELHRRGAEEALRLCRLFHCAHAILKEKSPSCGSGRVYDGTFTGTLTDGDGVTAALLKANGIEVIGETQAAAFLKTP